MELGVYASPAYIKRWGKPDTVADLDKHDYIWFSYGEMISIPLTMGDEKAAIEQKPRIRINDVLSCKRAAIDGMGFAIMPNRIATQDVMDKRLVPLLTDYSFPMVTIYAIYASRQWMSAKLKAFLQCLDGWT